MKLSKIIKKAEENRRIQEATLYQKLTQEALVNPRISRFAEIDPFYLSFGFNSELVAILPCVENSEHRYNSVPTLTDENKRLSPVFLIDSTGIKVDGSDRPKYAFTFISENFTQAHYENNPIVLFFQGCDDGHVGKRFKTRQEAMDYLDCMLVFEDIFDDKEIQFHN